MILLTIFSIALGLASTIQEAGYCSDRFSKVLRLAYRADASILITDADAVGHDPLPKRIANASISSAGTPSFEKGAPVSVQDRTQDKGGTTVRSRLLPRYFSSLDYFVHILVSAALCIET
jgi:hypothetical protein